MKARLHFFVVISLLVSLASCTTGKKHFDSGLGESTDQVSIMAYNLENLFDTEFDEGTEDFSFLPLTLKGTPEHTKACNAMRSPRYRDECLTHDWNDKVVDRKLSRLADAILQVNGGRGPDLLLVSEVENIKILRKLSEEYLKPAAYKHVILIEGFDPRGIDVGMLSRLPQIGEAKLHKIPYVGKTEEDKVWASRSRGIIQADFTLPDGQKLRAFTVHFPNPSNPSYWRGQAIQHINKLKRETPKEYLVVAGGDFNISTSDENNNKFYEKHLGAEWIVSHLVGCEGCRGTNYYHSLRQWSFLDSLLFDPRMKEDGGTANWHLVNRSIRIPNESRYQKNPWLSPARFDENRPTGVSDHWPILAVIQKRSLKVQADPE